ncbi:MAG: MFS transporter [Planctomyces sp.]|nr:MFS transporter [Planctomyces sp.]
MTERAPIEATAGASSRAASDRGKWMALAAALLGWMFDGAEMGVFSMVGRRAVQDLLGIPLIASKAEEAMIGPVFGMIIAVFLVGAATGGVLFGWLGDRVGRVRAMSLSVLTYAVFTGLCGFAQDPLQLGVLRFIAALGMGGEWSLGVALVMEVWPNRSRALMAGLIGAAANAGYFLVGIVGILLTQVIQSLERGLLAVGLPVSTVEMLMAYDGWRIMMMLGTLPALLTFFFRIFVPESEKWLEEQAQGSTDSMATSDLLGVLVGTAGPALVIAMCVMSNIPFPVRIVGIVLGVVVAAGGYLFPAIRFVSRDRALGKTPPLQFPIQRMLLGAGLSGVALLGTWGSTQWAMAWAGQLTQGIDKSQLGLLWQYPKEYTQLTTSSGAIVGTILAAYCGNLMGRRASYTLLCVLSLLAVLGFYQLQSAYGAIFLISSFFLGVTTASFYGWLPLYLPELFSTRLRATGQGFAFNFGRVIAAIGTLQIGTLLAKLGDVRTIAGVQGGYAVACSVICLVYLCGAVLIWFAPETQGKELPE